MDVKKCLCEYVKTEFNNCDLLQTFCCIRPSSSGRWAATYQSPGAGLERLKVVELCVVTGRIRDRPGLHSVALGNNDPIGFMTGGAPHRI